jgi:hypothetical protein
MATTATSPLTEAEEAAILDAARLDALAHEKIFAAYRDHGFTVLDSDGEEYVEHSLVREAVIALLCESPVTDSTERKTKAVTKHALSAHLFPSVPAQGSEEYEEGGAVAAKVWKALLDQTWRATDPKHKSPGQKLLGQRGDGLVLVRAKVPVGEGMKVGMADAAYVTTDEDSLVKDFVGPFRDAVNTAAAELAKNLGMAVERNPALAERLTREVENGMKTATNLARSTLALSTGSDDGK